jgi:hypothetical protein
MEIQLSGYTEHKKHETKAHRLKKDEHIVPYVQINRVKSKMNTFNPSYPLKIHETPEKTKFIHSAQEYLKQGISKKKTTKVTQFCSFGELTFYYFRAQEITF